MATCATGPRIDEVRFPAMGTSVHLLVVGGDSTLLGDARERIITLEATWSRFVETSEVSALNRGGAHHVSTDTWLLITKAIAGWERTAGRFDPTVHDAVIAAGYPGGPTGSRSGMSQPTPGCAGIRTDHDARIIEFPDGVRFDPGGIGKGLAADLVTAELLNAGASGALVSLGGDLRVRGESPRGGAWTVDLAEPHVAPSRIARLVLSDGAVATSTTERRRWTTTDGAHRHHLIDPVTGRPHDRSIRFASVITRDGWWAEACAKQLFVVPPCELDNCLSDAEGIVVDADMVTHRSAGFERFER